MYPIAIVPNMHCTKLFLYQFVALRNYRYTQWPSQSVKIQQEEEEQQQQQEEQDN